MLNKIHINKYKKFKDNDFCFSKGVNIIAGTNGTCKTSLLYLVSNSFKANNKKHFKNEQVAKQIKAINKSVNPKVESLTRGDKKYNDPSNGFEGALLSCEYSNGQEINFRKHNSKKERRYALKPYYKKGKRESLPYACIIYLGLDRLVAFGEFNEDNMIKKLSKNFPEDYKKEVLALYEEFTNYNIRVEDLQYESMGNIKNRGSFVTDQAGIDSNTISAGEDNLLILLYSLVSLKLYFKNLKEEYKESTPILLIDEFDATLHPEFQLRLLSKFVEYANRYKIQIFFTTHSLTLIEEAINKKLNIIYLIDNMTSVYHLLEVDIYKIKAHLYNKSVNDILRSKFIPIFTEDQESRHQISMLFEHFSSNPDKYKDFTKIVGYFHFPDICISSEALKKMFSDDKLLHSVMRSICILDGDISESKDNFTNNFIMTLPGTESPEKLVFDYAESLLESDSVFWSNETVINLGLGKAYYIKNIKSKLEEIKSEYQSKKSLGNPTKGFKRENYKKLYNENKEFYKLIFQYWIYENPKLVNDFYNNLKIMFKKVCEYHDINASLWNE